MTSTVGADGDESIAETDICIIGAGPAGLSIARELIGGPLRVCVVEGGGDLPDGPVQALARAENVGLPYPRLEQPRLRAFGGNSHLWFVPMSSGVGLRLRPLDADDFERRDWVPHSGWPFGAEELERYYARAQTVFGLGPFDYDAGSWERAERPVLSLDGEDLETVMFQFASGEPFHTTYREELQNADNVTTLLGANVTELVATASGTAIESIRIARMPSTRIRAIGGRATGVRPSFDADAASFTLRARVFVLAAGGTENPRLLLASSAVHRDGVGNDHDLVGRFFMEHPHLRSGRLTAYPSDLVGRLGLYETHSEAGTEVMAKVAVTAAAARRDGLLRYCAGLDPTSVSAGVRSFFKLAQPIRRGRPPQQVAQHLRNVAADRREVAAAVGALLRRGTPSASTSKVVGFDLSSMSEQAPNPESRVTLSADVDALGTPRARVDWRLTDLDMRTVAESQKILQREFRRAGLGEVQVDQTSLRPPVDLHGGWHQMGTTRMHASPRHGVVDGDGRMHGVANLFVAGASVFPTCGYANPTLTVVALAIRLADELRSELTGPTVRT